MSHAPPPFSTQRRAPSLLPISRDVSGREGDEEDRRTPASLAWLPLRVVSLVWTLFYRTHTTCVEFLLDATLGTLEESAKTVNYELFASVARFANAWSAVIITLLFSPGYYQELRKRFRTYAGSDTPPKPSSLNAFVELGEALDDSLQVEEDDDSGTDDEEEPKNVARDMIEETIEGLKWDKVINYDERTTEDLIRQAGYPYEKIMVLTEDGDKSKEGHAYWKFSMNELGLQDVPAFMDKIMQGNYETYGTVKPLDVSAYYHLIDIPVHLVGGSKDGIVPAANTRLHYKVLRECGRDVTYKEFNYGHLDFTVSVKDELKVYILKLLQLGDDQKQGRGSEKAAPMDGSAD
eukprot:jgi/Pico_ML_1/53115/g3723.t1